MNFVTKSVTTIFFTSFTLYYHIFEAVFLPLYIVEGGIYGAYCHQNIFNALISLLKRPVFLVVTKMVTNFERNGGHAS